MLEKMRAKAAEIMARRAEGEKGFTLIELLVVVVIIGILVAIAIPLYLHFENNAHSSGASSDVHGLTNLVRACESDNNGTLPPFGTQTGNEFSFASDAAGTALAACSNDTYNLSSNDDATYTDNGNGTFTIAVNNTDSGKTWTYTSADGTTVES